jgi:DNA-binding transcriptional ArsR family regulator
MVFLDEPSMKRLLGWLIAGTKGGMTRAEIIVVLKETPQNANQLASRLEKDYRTIRHHLGILSKNGIITSTGDRYGTTYSLTSQMEENYVVFEEIVGKIWKRPKDNDRE